MITGTIQCDDYIIEKVAFESRPGLHVTANLVGTDVVVYEAWDNIRAIDYLISRPEVDLEKIGMTGLLLPPLLVTRQPRKQNSIQ
ncbi:MAG: hypothetical protein GH151_01965 [Bacteroidetes bacterium]|nr:hypothetical protein [Bacteroidota bacterium]